MDAEANHRQKEQKELIDAEVRKMCKRLEAEACAYAEMEAREKLECEERQAEDHTVQEACVALGLESGAMEDPPLVNRFTVTPALLQMWKGGQDNISPEESDEEDDHISVNTQTENNLLAKQEGEEDLEEDEVVDTDENQDDDYGTPV